MPAVSANLSQTPQECVDPVSVKFKNATVAVDVSFMASVVTNTITCPFTVLLNLLVMWTVKRRRRLQSKTNILLACLATPNLLTGLLVQPLFIAWKLLLLSNGVHACQLFNVFSVALLLICIVLSSLHLVLVTCERLIAIKYTMYYERIVTKRNLTLAVAGVWVLGLFCELSRIALKPFLKRSGVITSVVVVLSVLFIISSYAVLFRETLRHQKRIKNQLLSQGDAARELRENKALKTVLVVVGSVILCYLPLSVLGLINYFSGGSRSRRYQLVFFPWIRFLCMLNSLLNPLIYCWRQKEMRKAIFGISNATVETSG